MLRGKPQTPTATVAWLQDYKWFLNLARSRRRYALQEQRLLRQAVQARVVPLHVIPRALRKQVSDSAPEALLRFGESEGLQRLADVIYVIDTAKKILEPRAASLRNNGVNESERKLGAAREAAATGVEKHGDGAFCMCECV